MADVADRTGWGAEQAALADELRAMRARLAGRDDPGGLGAPHEALDEVEAALERLDQGTYGSCVDCGEAIPVERLEVVPTASRCVACQQRRE